MSNFVFLVVFDLPLQSFTKPGNVYSAMRYFPESRTRLLTLPLFFLSMLTGLFAQAQSQQLSGRIVIDKTKTPAVSPNIFLLRQPAKTFSDASGNFSLKIPTLRKDDTVLISMVGYETLRIPLLAAMGRTEFQLREKSETLEGVTVKAFSTHDVQGSLSESVGYYRSWYSRGNGNEIGRVFQIPYEEYKIDKIRFKLNNMCDTCLVRLHIRTMSDRYPDEELLEDSVAVYVHKLTLDDKAPEFDLRDKDLTFSEGRIYIGFEVLHCGFKPNNNCYFAFAGTDKGEYIYRVHDQKDWTAINDDYTIYIKLFLRY